MHQMEYLTKKLYRHNFFLNRWNFRDVLDFINQVFFFFLRYREKSSNILQHCVFVIHRSSLLTWNEIWSISSSNLRNDIYPSNTQNVIAANIYGFTVIRYWDFRWGRKSLEHGIFHMASYLSLNKNCFAISWNHYGEFDTLIKSTFTNNVFTACQLYLLNFASFTLYQFQGCATFSRRIATCTLEQHSEYFCSFVVC